MLETRNASFLIQHFITTPQISPGLSRQAGVFLEGRSDFFCAYPCTLPSNELIILSLDAGSASDVEILGLKVRIIQLFRSLRKKHSGRVKLQISWL